MSIKPNIAIVGLGNIGWNLALRLHQCGYSISQIVSRHPEENRNFANKIGAAVISSSSLIDDEPDLIFLCLPDDALQNTAEEITSSAALIHCSGSTPIFKGDRKAGVLYPFQTFTKEITVNWDNVPVFIESNNNDLRDTLMSVASDLSNNAREATPEQRQAVHIAGVFGANFVNHTLSMAKQVLEKENIDFEVLMPLLEETFRKAFTNGPNSSQTGPARRGDKKMIAKHLEVLQNEDSLHAFYKLFSNDLMKQFAS